MATSVWSGDDGAAHLSTDQWQSFEMRMRRRRVERLLARASEACHEGRQDAAREAVAEIELLSPSEPRLQELRARIDALSPTAVISPVAPPLIEQVPESSNFAEAIPLGLSSPQPFVVPPSNELLFDLPLAVEEPEITSQPASLEPESRRSSLGLALAAMALLVCGVAGYFLGPRLVDIARPRPGTGTQPAATSVAIPPQPTDVRPLESKGDAPVQVAVDEIPAANTTVETPPEPPAIVPQPIVPSPVATTSSEPPAGASPAPPTTTHVEAPSLPQAQRPAPIAALPQEPAATIEKPPAPTVAETPVASGIAASAPTANIEMPPAVTPAPPPPPSREAAATSAPRDEERIRAVLDQYAAAYSRLDAAAASAIFPGIDRRALARAFDGLSSQKVSLGACDVRVAIEAAIVDCAGSSTWTPKIGGGTRTEPRRWQFRLRELSGEWQIVTAKVR